MHSEVTFAGFGGQGVLLAGKMLAHAALDEGREVVWLPSYGPEMRGGTANCNVVISDRPIGSPVFASPGAAVVLNRPSLDKFGPRVKLGGLLLINSSLIEVPFEREGVDVLRVPCNAIAQELGTGRAANIVALGAYLGRTGVVTLESVRKLIAETFAEKPKVVEINYQALQRGYEAGRA